MKKKEYNRVGAFNDFERNYNWAMKRLAEPGKWLTKQELNMLHRFDDEVRRELESKRDTDGDVLSVSCEMETPDPLSRHSARMVVYWLIESTLAECPGLRSWYLSGGKVKSHGEVFDEIEGGLKVTWSVDLRKYYSKEVWS